MIRKTVSLTLWVFCFQLIAYIIHEYFYLNLSLWYQALNKSPLHPPEALYPFIWSALYMMITIAGWLLWQDRKKPGAKSVLGYFGVQMLMNWAWTPLFFRFHFIGFSFFWTLGILFVTFLTIIRAAEKFETPAILLTPYLLWLLYVCYLTGFLWLNN